MTSDDVVDVLRKLLGEDEERPLVGPAKDYDQGRYLLSWIYLARMVSASFSQQLFAATEEWVK